ncbi:MAG: sialidase family protein, partial [Blastocatellia bacterium]
MNTFWRFPLHFLLFVSTALTAFPQSAIRDPQSAMREIPDAQKFLIANETKGAPSKKGWYYHVLNVTDTPAGLLCVYRRTDSHTAVISDIMSARSTDGGRTWTDQQLISHSDVWNEGGLWVAPQLSKLKDGRLVIISDFGKRVSGQDWPMLSQWQKPNRGMSNHLWWSRDNGKTWDGPTKIDDVGGEPGYIIELSNGTLVYTRTEARDTDLIWNPPLPWGGNYYRNSAVFSDDGGKTWNRSSIISDEPLQGDCEIGLIELAPNKLMAVTRIGLATGGFGQPSRFIFSDDNGKTWGRP